MYFVPKLALVWFAMAAAMLPASARPVHAVPARQTDSTDRPVDLAGPRSQDAAVPTKAPSAPPVGPEQKIVAAAPAMDVWDGHAVRMGESRIALGRPILPLMFPHTANLAFNPAPVCRSADSVPSCAAVFLSERDWLACRDTHAPPNRD